MLELNKHVVVPGGFQFAIADGLLRLSENIDTRGKNVSVFNQVERLNKHPALFINYLRILAANKGMSMTIDQETVERAEAQAKDPRTNYRLQSILTAPDLTAQQYEELSARKKQGKTTTEENFQVEHCFWQRYLVQTELDPELLVEFMYDENPLDNFLALVDIRNHKKEDNFRSARFL